MSFASRTLPALTSFLVLACSGQGGSGGQTAPSNPQCATSCFDNCILCEKKSGSECSAECSTLGTGGAPGTGGVTASTGGTAQSAGAGGDTSAGTGGVTGTGGDTSASTGGAPAVVTQSYTFTTDAFDVPVNGEVYMCQDFANPFNGQNIDIMTSESQMTSGSHHMFAFKCPPSSGSFFDCVQWNPGGPVFQCPGSGAEIHDYVHAAQTPNMIQTYPPGVGRYLAGTDGLRLMAHYLNTTTSPITAVIQVRVDYVDSSQVTAHAAAIFLNDLNLRVPQGISTQTKVHQMPPHDVNILGGASHMHMRGIGFSATTDQGAVVYEGNDWNEPIPNSFDPPLAVPYLNGVQNNITVSCTYDNQTGGTLTFGDSARLNEMCIYSGVYYPAPWGGSIIDVGL